MKILVTGAAGFIGSHLAERLAGEGHSVVGIDAFTDAYPRAIKEANANALVTSGVAVRELDLASDPLEPLLRDTEIVYHLAAQPGIAASTPFEVYLRNNIVATHRLLLAATTAQRLRGFLNISTSSVYGNEAVGSEDAEPRPTSYYGVTKLAAEQLALSYHRGGRFPVSSFRLFSVYGPRERPEKLVPRLMHAMLNKEEFPLHQGSDRHVRSFTYVSDIVNGLIAPLTMLDRCMGEIFNLGTESAETTGTVIRLVEELAGRPVRIKECPPRPGDQAITTADIRKARRVLGFEPSTPLREGLARTIAYFTQEATRQSVERRKG